MSFNNCEGCLVVRSGHGPQAEVAQGIGPGPLVPPVVTHMHDFRSSKPISLCGEPRLETVAVVASVQE